MTFYIQCGSYALTAIREDGILDKAIQKLSQSERNINSINIPNILTREKIKINLTDLNNDLNGASKSLDSRISNELGKKE